MKIFSCFRPPIELGKVRQNTLAPADNIPGLDVSGLPFAVAGPGEPGPIALLNSTLRPGKTAAPVLIIGEREGELANAEFEDFVTRENLGVISLRADQFDGAADNERTTQFFHIIDELCNQKLIDENTEIYVNLHGIAEGGKLFLGTSDNRFHIDAHRLLSHLRRSRDDPPSTACTLLLCCQSKVLHEQVKDFPHNFFFLSGRDAIFDNDATATAQALFRLSCRQPEAPPHPELVLKEAAQVSGENPTLAGNGSITTLKLMDVPSNQLQIRPLQISRHLDAKLEHGSFQSYAKLLNKYGIQALNQDPGKYPHLFTAIDSSKDFFLKMMLLIALGQPVNPPSQRDKQLLHIACEENDPDLIKLLLENSADPYQKNKAGLTVRELALALGHDEIVAVLDNFSQGQRFPECSIENFVEVMIRSNDIEVIKVLQQKSGFFWEIRRSNGESMMSYAVREKKHEILKFMLKNESQLSRVKNNKGNTPLHLACIKGDATAVALLLEKKSNLSSKNKRGYTPLIFAARRGHLEPVRALHEAGADLNQQSASGKTALHYAVEKNRPDIVDELLRLGADASVRNNEGKLALDLAMKNNSSSLIAMLSPSPMADPGSFSDKNAITTGSTAQISENNDS